MYYTSPQLRLKCAQGRDYIYIHQNVSRYRKPATFPFPLMPAASLIFIACGRTWVPHAPAIISSFTSIQMVHTHTSHTTASILDHLLCLSFLIHPAATSVSNYWKKLTCGVFRSFNFFSSIIAYLTLQANFQETREAWGACIETAVMKAKETTHDSHMTKQWLRFNRIWNKQQRANNYCRFQSVGTKRGFHWQFFRIPYRLDSPTI